jgi:hypothetical protein
VQVAKVERAEGAEVIDKILGAQVVTFKLDRTRVEQLDRLRLERGLSRSVFVRELVEESLDRRLEDERMRKS